MVFSSSVVRVAGAGVAAGLGAVAAAGDVLAGVMAFLAGVAAGAVAGVGAAAGAAAGGVCARASAGKRVNSKRIFTKYTVRVSTSWGSTLDRVLNRFGESWPEMRREPGTDTNFRRSLPEFGCLSQGLPNGTGCPFVVSPKRLSTRPGMFAACPARAVFKYGNASQTRD